MNQTDKTDVDQNEVRTREICKKLGKGLTKTDQKFTLDRVYRLIKSRSLIFTEIAHTLEEDVRLFYIIKHALYNL